MDNANATTVSAFHPGIRAHELAALVLLINTKTLPLDHLTAQVEHFGAVDTMRRMTDSGRTFESADVVAAVTTAEEWLHAGYDIRVVFDDTYPLNLSNIFNKPPMVFIKGEWIDECDSLSVAVVGTRKPSVDGLKRATAAGRKLAKEGITVISGLATGIDAAAHSAALDAGGRTIAVMGTGINRVFPKENGELATRIVASGGALITQFFPDQPPTQWTFPMRNVVMSGLSLATLVIEASETSGARQQARHALQHGRSVFLAASLVKTHLWARKMVEEGMYGTHAIVVDSIDDVIERMVGAYDAPAVAAV